MKGRPVFVGCVAVLVLTACGGAGVSAGSHPHTAVASSSVQCDKAKTLVIATTLPQ